ncbi:FAS1-like dehydratase domain-containing protein [Nocardia spumae]|uniref:FAS1-like dehydratase domain-containing protein n=1 Tax=Nocardia spumae TaxID=2887190 RepID=UPI001D157A1F|nr:MaoC family dehydratase N-terminal domain-containing protein [Nocardia spumae]
MSAEQQVPTFEMSLERGKIGEFAKATMSENPAYWGKNPVIPPTFLTTAGFFWQTAESKAAGAHGLDPKRTLHAEQEYVFHGEPPRAGTELTAATRIADRFTKEGRRGGALTFVKIVTEFRDETGRLVAEQRTTAVETARAPKES